MSYVMGTSILTWNGGEPDSGFHGTVLICVTHRDLNDTPIEAFWDGSNFSCSDGHMFSVDDVVAWSIPTYGERDEDTPDLRAALDVIEAVKMAIPVQHRRFTGLRDQVESMIAERSQMLNRAPIDYPWISTESRLPETDMMLVDTSVYTWDGETVKADEFADEFQRDEGGAWVSHHGGWFCSDPDRKVTHWCYRWIPLPPPISGDDDHD